MINTAFYACALQAIEREKLSQQTAVTSSSSTTSQSKKQTKNKKNTTVVVAMDVEDGDTLSVVDPSEDDDVDNATPNDVDIGSDSQDGDSDSESDIDSKREVEDLEWKFFSKDDTKDDAQDLEGVSRDKFKLKLVPAFDNMSCLSYLFLFLPVSFFKHIAFQTNLYAAQEKKKMAAEAPQIVGRH